MPVDFEGFPSLGVFPSILDDFWALAFWAWIGHGNLALGRGWAWRVQLVGRTVAPLRSRPFGAEWRGRRILKRGVRFRRGAFLGLTSAAWRLFGVWFGFGFDVD